MLLSACTPAPTSPPLTSPTLLGDSASTTAGREAGRTPDNAVVSVAPTTGDDPSEVEGSVEGQSEPSAVVNEEPGTDSLTMSSNVRVINFCLCRGPRGQTQIKLKPSIENLAERNLPLRVENFRLVVDHDFAGEWSPTDPVADIERADGSYWVPANADGAAEEFDGAWTFATHWDTDELPQGDTYTDPGVKTADLVFFVPSDASGGLRIVGLAHVSDEGDLLGLSPFSEWTGYADPNEF